jgi:mannose-6-phosphate isomerase
VNEPGRSPLRLSGSVKHYEWGDTRFLPELLGIPPDGRPWAELWLGTHPNGPATLPDGQPLSTLTGDLPYLLKVLCAARPLSLQAHPDAVQAVDGHRRGVFPDRHAKPELLVALTPFEAFCGIRPAESAIDLLAEIGATELARHVESVGAGTTLRRLYRGEIDVGDVVAVCATSDRPEAQWVARLENTYPGEISVVATLLLNYVELRPGEALHLTAGNLHAYLRGSGVELMGASDNVVRGGLTVKPVDVDELLAVLDTAPLLRPVMDGTDGGRRYRLPEAGCTLVRRLAGESHASIGHEIALSMEGTCWYLPPGSDYECAAETYVVVGA